MTRAPAGPPRGGDLPRGTLSLRAARAGALLWDIDYAGLERDVVRASRDLVEHVAGEGVAGVAIDLAGVVDLSPERTESLFRFADALQCRGVGVVLYSVPSRLLAAPSRRGMPARFAVEEDLTASLQTLREFADARPDSVPGTGSGTRLLRLPARPLSLPSLCAFARARLRRHGLDGEAREGLLEEAYLAMGRALDASRGRAAGDLSVSAAVHGGRATVILVDSVDSGANEVIRPGKGGRVDRIHRFRIPERHTALVLEKDLAPAGVAQA